MEKLIVYDDAKEFGGHEIVTLEFLKRILEKYNYEIVFIHSSKNEQLKKKIQDIASEKINNIHFTYNTESFQSIRSFFSLLKLIQLCQILKKLKAEKVIVIQGTIEISSLALIAGKILGIKTISYIPFGFNCKEMGVKFSFIRDLFNWILYKLPDRFITISKYQEKKLLKRGVVCPVSIVYNFVNNYVERNDFKPSNYDDKKTIGIIGRIQFKQKNQNYLVDTVIDKKTLLANCKFIIVGDGPDRNKLSKLIVENGLTDNIDVIGWQDSSHNIYRNLNALLIVSVFEGVPLVMLEAIFAGIIVISSDFGGANEFLPEEWLFNLDDKDSLVEKLNMIECKENKILLKKTQEKFRKIFLRKNPEDTFLEAIKK